jgi:hypothetical protein
MRTPVILYHVLSSTLNQFARVQASITTPLGNTTPTWQTSMSCSLTSSVRRRQCTLPLCYAIISRFDAASHRVRRSGPGGLYSFFNGMCPFNVFFQGVACAVVQLELQVLRMRCMRAHGSRGYEAILSHVGHAFVCVLSDLPCWLWKAIGFTSSFESMPVRVPPDKDSEWSDIKRKYFFSDTYYLPHCVFDGGLGHAVSTEAGHSVAAHEMVNRDPVHAEAAPHFGLRHIPCAKLASLCATVSIVCSSPLLLSFAFPPFHLPLPLPPFSLCSPSSLPPLSLLSPSSLPPLSLLSPSSLPPLPPPSLPSQFFSFTPPPSLFLWDAFAEGCFQ